MLRRFGCCPWGCGLFLQLFSLLIFLSMAIHSKLTWLSYSVFLWQYIDFVHGVRNESSNEQPMSDIPSASHKHSSDCGVYFARSTIPGAGMGMFAGRSYQVWDTVTPSDIVIPLIDLGAHNSDFNIDSALISVYHWDGDAVTGLPEESYENTAFCPGIGAAVNCYYPLNNVQGMDDHTILRSTGLHRSKDPGAGAITSYGGRYGYAIRDIQAGEELFAYYGPRYFTVQEDIYGKMPFPESYESADELLQRYIRLRDELLLESSMNRINSTGATVTGNISDRVSSKLHVGWYNLMTKLASVWPSRTLNALPENAALVDPVAEKGTSLQHYNRSIRSLEWLDENGYCMDHLVPGESTIPQAGRGAFAKRFIPKDGLVAPAPLIHVDKNILDIFPTSLEHDHKKEFIWANLTAPPRHKQLLYNYCFGHDQIAAVLCPYGVMTSLINHAPTKQQVNSKVVWNHGLTKKEWLDRPIDEWMWKTPVVLFFNFVAIRDISPGEEVLIDYGDDWAAAWKHHVETWRPPKRAESYRSAVELNEDSELILPTVSEGFYSTENVESNCLELFRGLNGRPEDDDDDDDGVFHSCRPILRLHEANGDIKYVAVALIYYEDQHTQMCYERLFEVLWNLSRDAFWFQDVPYSRDTHQPWSFRHTIGIPDELVPEAWKLPHDEHAAL